MDNQNNKNSLTKKACIISYNSRGFSAMHQDFIKTLASDKIVGDKLPIICNQENFILRGNFYKLSQACPDSHFIFNPAIKTTLDKGRPKGGMFIAVPKSIKSHLTNNLQCHVSRVLLAEPGRTPVASLEWWG